MGKVFSNILLSLGAIIITLIFIEIILHILDIPKYSTPAENFRRPDPVYHHAFIPNTTALMKKAEFTNEYKINSLGLRDKEINLEKSKYRILLVGDSFTEGEGVNYNDMVSTQLQKMLDEKGYHAEVVNGGIAGGSPMVENLYLRNYLINLKPDLVILNFDLSDVQDDYNYEKTAVKDSAGEITAIPPDSFTAPGWKDLEYTCSKYSFNLCILTYRAGRAIFKKYAITTGDIESDNMFLTRFNITAEQTDPHYNRTFHEIKRISDFAKEKNITFILVSFPRGNQIEGEWKAGRKMWGFEQDKIYSLDVFERMHEFANENRIFYIDTYLDFNSSTENPLFFSQDFHMTAAGYKVLAQAIFKQMFLNDEVKNSILQIER